MPGTMKHKMGSHWANTKYVWCIKKCPLKTNMDKQRVNIFTVVTNTLDLSVDSRKTGSNEYSY